MLTHVCAGGQDIPFRQGQWAGPAWRILQNGSWRTEAEEAALCNGWYQLNYKGVALRRRCEVIDGCLHIYLEAHNGSSQIFDPDRLDVLLGIDTYMVGYPQWDQCFFPTMLQCEKEHFYGYFASPGGAVLAIACPQPIASWQLHYNQLFSDGGHRVEGVSLSLLYVGPLPEHHPVQTCLMPGECKRWDVIIKPAAHSQEAVRWCAQAVKAPVFCGSRLVFEPGEPAELTFEAPEVVTIRCGERLYPSQKQKDGSWLVRIPALPEGDAYAMTAECVGRPCTIHVCWRKEWSWYLQRAAEEALRKQQKATSHVESWYGYFSGLQAMCHFPDAARDEALLKNMKAMIPLVYDTEKGEPTHIPWRVQNTAGLVSICVDAWEATREEEWLLLAQKLAHYLIDSCRSDDGAFRCHGIHYTCVLYIAKCIQELWEAERQFEKHQDIARIHFEAVRRAVDDLVLHLDNIGTEGEHTFEDGMISCSMLQIGFFALQLPPEERAPYIAAAETLLAKHRCLERMESPDCRSRGTTIRFWEAQYDILVPANMITSPHGWTGWKTYGVWYLYLLTGKTVYLTDLMETLGSCMQLIDQNGDLRWAFCVDPQVQAGLFCEDPPASGKGRLIPSVYGECYLPMISHWYHILEGVPAFGYLGTFEGFDTDQGGCCDNDVHECFKAMAECVLTYGYVYENESGIHAYNGSLSCDDSGEIRFAPAEPVVKAVHINLLSEHPMRILFSGGERTSLIQNGWITEKTE